MLQPPLRDFLHITCAAEFHASQRALAGSLVSKIRAGLPGWGCAPCGGRTPRGNAARTAAARPATTCERRDRPTCRKAGRPKERSSRRCQLCRSCSRPINAGSSPQPPAALEPAPEGASPRMDTNCQIRCREAWICYMSCHCKVSRLLKPKPDRCRAHRDFASKMHSCRDRCRDMWLLHPCPGGASEFDDPGICR